MGPAAQRRAWRPGSWWKDGNDASQRLFKSLPGACTVATSYQFGVRLLGFVKIFNDGDSYETESRQPSGR